MRTASRRCAARRELSGYSARDIVSGAGHDAAYVSRVAPAAMIFVPCRGGISHNEAEFTAKEQCAKGAQVLLQAVLDYDRGSCAGARRAEGSASASSGSCSSSAAPCCSPPPATPVWNASIKRTLDPLATTVLIAVGAALVALPVVPFAGWPAPACWPWLIASIVIHLFYFAGLIESYRAGDLGQVYPIARGAAPLMTATMTTVFVGERLGLFGWGGIVLLAAGVLLLSLRGGRDLAKLDRAAVGFALFTAVTICAYSVVDGIGARAAGPGKANAYSLMLFVGIAPVVVGYALVRRGTAVIGGDGAVLEDRARRRRARGDLLQHRDLGDDGGADRHRRGAARDQRAVRRDDRGGVPREPLRAARIVAALMIVAGLVLLRLA